MLVLIKLFLFLVILFNYKFGVKMNRPQTFFDHQQIFFREYQENCAINPDAMRAELRRWEAIEPTILNLPLEQQAEYADYVTRKMCELDEEIVVAMARSIFHSLVEQNEFTACSVGNVAYIIIMMERFPAHQILIQDLVNIFQVYLQSQRD